MYSFLACGVFVAVWAFLSRSSCGERGPVYSYSAQASRSSDASWPGAGAVGHAGFSTCGPWANGCGSRVLERRRSSFGAGAQLLRGMWDLPGSGIELCLRCWQKDAFPLSHPRSPIIVSLQRSA